MHHLKPVNIYFAGRIETFTGHRFEHFTITAVYWTRCPHCNHITRTKEKILWEYFGQKLHSLCNLRRLNGANEHKRTFADQGLLIHP